MEEDLPTLASLYSDRNPFEKIVEAAIPLIVECYYSKSPPLILSDFCNLFADTLPYRVDSIEALTVTIRPVTRRDATARVRASSGTTYYSNSISDIKSVKLLSFWLGEGSLRGIRKESKVVMWIQNSKSRLRM